MRPAARNWRQTYLKLAPSQGKDAVINPTDQQSTQIACEKSVQRTDQTTDESYRVADKKLAKQTQMRTDDIAALYYKPICRCKYNQCGNRAQNETQNISVETHDGPSYDFFFRFVGAIHGLIKIICFLV